MQWTFWTGFMEAFPNFYLTQMQHTLFWNMGIYETHADIIGHIVFFMKLSVK